MQCLMELDNPKFGLSYKEKLAYLGYQFVQTLGEGAKDPRNAPVTHLFEPGVYIREMFIPAEFLFIGRPHTHGHRCELLSGRILLITEAAKLHLDAPAEMVTDPEYVTCLYTKTDVVARTYHPNPHERRDVEAMEAEIFRPAAEMIELGEQVAKKIARIESQGTS